MPEITDQAMIDAAAAQRVACPRNRQWYSADWDQTFEPITMDANGFNLQGSLRYLPYRSYPLYVAQLTELMKVKGSYRARYICSPFGLDPIPGPGNVDRNEHVNVGTIIYGFNFAAVDGNVSDFEVGITDACSNQSLFEGTPVATMFDSGGAGAVTGLSPVLIEPRLVDSAGGHPKITIRIRNKVTTDQRCQLVIFCAEPCAVQGRGPGRTPSFGWQRPAQGGMVYGGA